MAKNTSVGNGMMVLFLIIAAGLVVYQLFLKNDSPLHVQQQGGNYVHALLTDEELVYTKHATCRMECREIDKSEVEDILKTGIVNWNKSDENDTPCPSYALEGVTKDGQTVRIVFADCNNATKVITTIDLKNEYDCYCR
mgnify:CR=1 FL=1